MDTAVADGEPAAMSADQASAQAVCAGYMLKMSEHVKKFNKRWFVLWPREANQTKGRLLLYYTKNNDAKPRGSWPLMPGGYSLRTEADKKFAMRLVITINEVRLLSPILPSCRRRPFAHMPVMCWSSPTDMT